MEKPIIKPLNPRLDEITDAAGASQIMGVSRQRIKQLTQERRLVPVKVFGTKHLYLKADVLYLKYDITPRYPRGRKRK
jgi:hypothetical protein